MTLAVTLGKATYNWRDAFTGMKTIYEAGGLYHFNQRVPPSVDGGVPPTLRRARHIPVPHHVQNLKWFKQCMRNHWISFRNATWSKVSRNSRSIQSIHTYYAKKNRDIRHPINIPTSIPSCTTGRNLFPLFWHKGRFPQRFTTVPVAHEVGAGATNTGGAWIHSQVQGGWRKITRFLSQVEYLIQDLGTDSSEVQSPKCASSFKLSSINQAKESIRTKVIDEYPWHLSPKYRSL